VFAKLGVTVKTWETAGAQTVGLATYTFFTSMPNDAEFVPVEPNIDGQYDQGRLYIAQQGDPPLMTAYAIVCRRGAATWANMLHADKLKQTDAVMKHVRFRWPEVTWLGLNISEDAMPLRSDVATRAAQEALDREEHAREYAIREKQRLEWERIQRENEEKKRKQEEKKREQEEETPVEVVSADEEDIEEALEEAETEVMAGAKESAGHHCVFLPDSDEDEWLHIGDPVTFKDVECF
jgi:hypothetical protein